MTTRNIAIAAAALAAAGVFAWLLTGPGVALVLVVICGAAMAMSAWGGHWDNNA